MALRILIIDDSPADQEIASRALERLPGPMGPAEVLRALDWAEARRHLDAGGLDLVLLDYHLPGTTGLDVLRDIRRMRGAPPVIMMTGQGDVATAVATLREGAQEYVPKAADCGPGLCLAVERVVERAHLERELAAARGQLAAYAADLEERVAARTAVVQTQAREIEELYLKTEEVARLKEELLHNLSHELRTPLNGILGFAELLRMELETQVTPEVLDMLATVRVQGKHLLEMIESLLALRDLRGGTEGVHVSRFSLAALLEELRADAVALGSDKALTFAWKGPCAPCEVEHDREKIRVIAYHLLSNAIKFTSAGQVEVELASTPEGGVRLQVSDTGIGLPADRREVLLDDFRQLDGSSTRRYGGLGLGLGIVKRYTALLRGAVHLEAAPGAGTTVSVELPPMASATSSERALS